MSPNPPHPLHLARPVAAGLAVAFAFSALFVTAFHAPRAHGLELGLAGPPRVVAGARAALERAQPGRFAVERYAGAAAARSAVRDGAVRAALVLGASRDVAFVAGAYGPAAGDAARAAFAAVAGARRHPLAVVDDVPLPAHDARGLSAFFTAFACVVGGMAFGLMLMLLGGRHALAHRLAALGAFAALAGLVVALTVDPLVGALTGSFAAVAGVAALAVLAVAAATHGLAGLGGRAGMALAPLLFVALGQSTAGGALGPDFLPALYGDVSGALPTGAAISALREVVYFGGAGAGTPLLVLGAWAVAGTAGVLLSEHVPRPRRR